jgi:hypothetical protein
LNDLRHCGLILFPNKKAAKLAARFQSAFGLLLVRFAQSDCAISHDVKPNFRRLLL